MREEIGRLETDLEQKQVQYKESFGDSSWFSWVKMPTRAVKTSAVAVGSSISKSFEYLNPFSRKFAPFDECIHHGRLKVGRQNKELGSAVVIFLCQH